MGVANSEKYIYICTRLFNYNDKLQAEYLERSLRKTINCKTFVPFRDTNENKLIGPNRAIIIYDADLEKLNSGDILLLAVLYDGICKDEGISFEIGYAFGKGIPIYIINTDFIWYAVGNREFIFDPIVEKMCSGYLHQYHIADKCFFYDSLMESQKEAFDLAAKEINENLTKYASSVHQYQKEIEYDVFIDFGGGKYEYQREFAKRVADELTANNKTVKVSRRYSRGAPTSAQEDLSNLLKSAYYVCLGDEIELNPGTAALLGLSRCMGKTIILYESSDLEIHGENGHCMKKNLMIDYSVDMVAKTAAQIVDYITEG